MPRLFTGLEIPAEIGRHALRPSAAACRAPAGSSRKTTTSPCASSATSTGHRPGTCSRCSATAAGASPSRSRSTGSTPSAAASPARCSPASAATSELDDLQAEQERLVRRVGLPPERRRFTPHVTLARLRDASPTMSRATSPSAGLSEAVLHGASASCLFVPAPRAAAPTWSRPPIRSRESRRCR